MSKAYWDDDKLMVFWYDSETPEETAWWLPKTNLVLFEGNDEDFAKKYQEKPTAEQALKDILNWQLQGY